ncbi:MAG: conjugal transfer protein TraX, partial [Clostridia bacterium]|nr:conjugal transfer protein TraX [Clostridia bacterium]
MEHLSILSGNQLKLVAMLTMLTDHIGMILFPRLPVFRIIGRLAMPLFAYMIAEGCRYTRRRSRYFLSVAGLGVLCQLAFSISAGSLYQNILLTFSLSIATVFAVDR